MTQEQKGKFNGLTQDIERINAEIQGLALRIRMLTTRDEEEYRTISKYCDNVYNLTEDLKDFINNH